MRKCKILFILLIFLGLKAYAGIEPDVVTEVMVSNMDVNRIVCPYPITDVVFSQEKGIIVKVTDRNAFVKLPVIVKTVDGVETEKKYYNAKTEIFVMCGGNVYTLLLRPAKIQAQTIYLTDTKGDMKKSYEYVKNNKYEDLMINLIDSLSNDKPEKGFVIKNVFKNYRHKNIDFTLSRIMVGGGFKVKEFIIYSKNKVTIENLELLNLPEIVDPKAVALFDNEFIGVTKGYVVEGLPNGKNW